MPSAPMLEVLLLKAESIREDEALVQLFGAEESLRLCGAWLTDFLAARANAHESSDALLLVGQLRMYSTEKGSNAIVSKSGRSRTDKELPFDSDSSNGCSQCLTDPPFRVLARRISQEAPDEKWAAHGRSPRTQPIAAKTGTWPRAAVWQRNPAGLLPLRLRHPLSSFSTDARTYSKQSAPGVNWSRSAVGFARYRMTACATRRR